MNTVSVRDHADGGPACPARLGQVFLSALGDTSPYQPYGNVGALCNAPLAP